MSPHRAFSLGITVAVALATAALVLAIRPDSGAAGQAAYASAVAPIEATRFQPLEQSPERGAPAFATRFDPADHGGHRQSWDVAQAPNGLIYVANSDGLLEYNGTDWRIIPVPGYRARAVTVGGDGNVYVGGEGTLGTLEADSLGQATYAEITGEADLGAETVWTAVATPRGVLFQTFGRLVSVEDSRVVDVELAPRQQRFHKAFSAGGTAYVRLEGTGLFEYRDADLSLLSGGEHFANAPVRALLDIDGRPGGTLLAVTDAELYRLDPPAAAPLVSVPTSASATLRQARAYHGCPVGPAGEQGLAITTVGAGVVIISPTGQVIEQIGNASGLTSDDLVLGCTTDDQGGLWLALSEGVLRVDAAAPLTVFDDRLGLNGAVYGVARVEDHLYVTSARGAYRLRPSTGAETATFEPVRSGEGYLRQAWSLLDTANGLLVAGTDGVFTIDGLEASPIVRKAAFALASGGELGSERVYVGLMSGLLTLNYVGGRWVVGDRVQGVTGEVRSVLPVENGAWVAETGGRLFHIDAEGEVMGAYGTEDGIPDGLASVQFIQGELVVLSASGPYSVAMNKGSIRLSPMEQLSETIAETVTNLEDGYGIRADEKDRLWISGRERTRAFALQGETMVDVTPPVLRSLGGVKGVSAEQGVLWVSTASGLLRLSGSGAGRYAATATTRVSNVEANGELAIDDHSATVPYGSPVRFRFAATAFQDPERTLYRTQLVGHDVGLSAWSDERFREYTNLSPGHYAFRVEAMTAQGVAARPAVAFVRVPAPWYLSVWAAVLGALLAGGAASAIAWGASRHHRLRADQMHARAEELDSLNAQLRHADEVKDSMLANTSHELRTPLTAILGFSEILTEHVDDDVQELAHHMLSAGNRLLTTVNDLLDVARLRSGKVELTPVETDATKVARRVAAELMPLADARGLALAVVPSQLSIVATLDPDAFARVLTNLVSNGLKFTDEGAVTVTVDANDGDLYLSVADTGQGMDAEFLPRLFDTFEQESTGYGRSAEGSGLGMAITSHLVALMDGEISVTSELGTGTTFLVRIPSGATATALPLYEDSTREATA